MTTDRDARGARGGVPAVRRCLTDAGYLVQAGAFLFVLVVLAWVLGFIGHSLYAWAPPAWLAWIYPGRGLP